MWVLKTEEEGRSVGQRDETRQGVDLLLLTKMEKEGGSRAMQQPLEAENSPQLTGCKKMGTSVIQM